ncbi:MAG TPA: hypothetical protein VHM70_00465 [Polyangiaceae bacterium]|jgi:hypothetical protein|nr:hypothetical protein [Polyangiaceae bacterium]
MSPGSAALLLGLALGTQHAFEPDHLAAVSVLNAETRSARHGMLLGALWGLGHSVSLVVVGTALALCAVPMPPALADVFEFAVALMLVVLGISACVRAARHGQRGPRHQHSHAHVAHTHSGPPNHVHIGRWTFAMRPLIVGMVHGLAGSGALTALVVSTLETTGARVAFMSLFGLGSVLGMATISGIASWPLARFTKDIGATRWLSGAVGLCSTIYGVAWGWPIIERLMS